jgi:transcriptional regulator with XRE-family HTH domain
MFDNVKCFENIQYMAKIRGVTVGELERDAGVSRGYLSRLLKGGGNTPTIIELIISISEKLNISIDSLIYGNLKGLTNKEQFVYDFVHKLIKSTEEGSLDWIQEKLTYDHDIEGYTNNKIFRYGVFNSKFNGSYQIVDDTIFSAILTEDEEDGRILIVKVIYSEPLSFIENEDSEVSSYELYITAKNDYKPVCSSALSTRELQSEINKLGVMIFEARSKIGLEESTKEAMEKFLKRTSGNQYINDQVT